MLEELPSLQQQLTNTKYEYASMYLQLNGLNKVKLAYKLMESGDLHDLAAVQRSMDDSIDYGLKLNYAKL